MLDLPKTCSPSAIERVGLHLVASWVQGLAPLNNADSDPWYGCDLTAGSDAVLDGPSVELVYRMILRRSGQRVGR